MKTITSVLLLASILVMNVVEAKNGMKRPVFHPFGDQATDEETVR